MADEDLGKPNIQEGGEEVSMVDISQETQEPSKEEIKVSTKGKVRKGMSSVSVSANEVVEKLKNAKEGEAIIFDEKIKMAQKDFDRAEAKLTMARIDAEYEPEEETPVTEKALPDRAKVKEVINEIFSKPENAKKLELLSEMTDLAEKETLSDEDYITLDELIKKMNEEEKPIKELSDKEEIEPVIKKTAMKEIIEVGNIVLCPKCNGKIKRRANTQKTSNGLFITEKRVCCNSKRNWLKFWRKPTCDYQEIKFTRID